MKISDILFFIVFLMLYIVLLYVYVIIVRVRIRNTGDWISSVFFAAMGLIFLRIHANNSWVDASGELQEPYFFLVIPALLLVSIGLVGLSANGIVAVVRAVHRRTPPGGGENELNGRGDRGRQSR